MSKARIEVAHGEATIYLSDGSKIEKLSSIKSVVDALNGLENISPQDAMEILEKLCDFQENGDLPPFSSKIEFYNLN
jgi:hypothetical protein